MRTYIWGGIAIVALLGSSQLALAGEINYGHVEEVHDTELHIEYRGPGGNQNFVCEVTSAECVAHGTTTPELFPAIGGATNYTNSPDGRYGIVGTAVEDETGSTTYRHVVYDVSGAETEEVAVVPYLDAVDGYRFPWAGDHVILSGSDGSVVTYDLLNDTISIIAPSQSELPLRSFSPHATYLSAYNYLDAGHRIWHTTTGEEIRLPSGTPAYVEFSQDEQFAAFKDDRSGYQTLYIADLKNDAQVERVFSDNFTIEDYVWFQDNLYAVGNTAENPYDWVLYRFDPATESIQVVSHDVSYGDYIRPISEHALSFLVIEGKNTHVALYRPERDEVEVVRSVADSPASAEIDRSVVDFGDGLKGVLYAPEDPPRKPDLFVWLHGGPKRQTSFGYHSYLSYAVYDELLERLVENGAYVLKLDYAGSYGHGSDFMDQLENQLGTVDVAHVLDASRDMQREYDIDDTYLIGNSYGGYLGPKVLVEHERYFDGAIAINGVFDWFDLLARIPSSPFKTYFAGLADLEDPEVNLPLYEQASIVTELPDLNPRKPLLLVYGENDATVPTWQTKEFFYNAEALGKNVSLLPLIGEEHIIRSRDSLEQLCDFVGEELRLKTLDCS